MTPADLAGLLAAEPRLRDPLRAVAALGLPQAWIGAGFLRNAAWDALAGLPFGANPPGDIDVVWFDTGRADSATDVAIEAILRAALPGVPWSVKNQARMAARNGDAPYAGVADAVSRWPETATAVLARWNGAGVDLAAPWGLDDLLGRVVRPTPGFAAGAVKHAVFLARCREKRWTERWSGLRILGG
ncbi:nucleotidyltransferase family protein [Paracraurococcus lichenis]|uniref:Nucleotidyltransferase family protein n=1 Tax=Paracraurococcus lichenis TaxID=3064888 RepID=A0ABT9DTH5_9PROT|nr:nucleotidyltransferase family protein [Paracraurococcus sp. LOR1-02]MDO9707198.1 nucleotidyltransferase family protein [Paracraurococcus sp. LOR1-02]